MEDTMSIYSYYLCLMGFGWRVTWGRPSCPDRIWIFNIDRWPFVILLCWQLKIELLVLIVWLMNNDEFTSLINFRWRSIQSNENTHFYFLIFRFLYFISNHFLLVDGNMRECHVPDNASYNSLDLYMFGVKLNGIYLLPLPQQYIFILFI